MNCLEFRRRLLEDPFTHDAAMIAHEESCPTCAKYARDVRTKEIQLRALLNNIPVPAELPNKIRLNIGLKKRQPAKKIFAWMMVSVFILGAGLAFITDFYPFIASVNNPIAQHVLQHTEQEEHLYDASQQVPYTQLSLLFKQFNAKADSNIGPITFASICPIQNHKGIHLAVNGLLGPVSVFYMPNEHINDSVKFSSTQFQGKIKPTHWGSIAVIGRHYEPLDQVMQHMEEMVTWPEDIAQAKSHWPANTLIAKFFINLHQMPAHNALQTHLE